MTPSLWSELWVGGGVYFQGQTGPCGEDQESSFRPKLPFSHLFSHVQPGEQKLLSISAEGTECRGFAVLVRDTAD